MARDRLAAERAAVEFGQAATADIFIIYLDSADCRFAADIAMRVFIHAIEAKYLAIVELDILALYLFSA